MESVASAIHREPWNKGKIVGQKSPFKVKDIWALRVRLQMEHRIRELGMRIKTWTGGVSEFLCKRVGLQLTEMRSPNSMVKRVRAAFQSRMGRVHFWLMLRRAR